jgi:transposase
LPIVAPSVRARWATANTERLDIVPAQLRVLVTVRPRYACRACTDGVTQAPAPAALIEG